MTVALAVLTGVVVLVAVLAVVIWGGSRMVRGERSGSSSSNAFGGFDVFDPSRERAARDLESQKHQGAVTPVPEDDDRPVRVDIHRNTVRIRRPRPEDDNP